MSHSRLQLGHWLASLLLTALGCGSDPPPPKEGPPFQGQTVRLKIVDDAPLAAAVRGLQGEWQARSGAELQVEDVTWQELEKTGEPAADAVIYPSRLIGDFAGRKWLSPLPERFADSQALAWSDVAQALREGETHWGSRTMAVPLGSRVLVCYYRADLLRRADKQPPRTWAEYQELARCFANRNLGKGAPSDGTPWQAAIEPLAEGWAGLTLLARAAPYARHRDYYSVLFDLNSMQPRIDQPPFVRALEELVDTARAGQDKMLHATPTVAVETLLAGQCAMAIGWPPAREPKTKLSLDASAVGCVPLPGVTESYDWNAGKFVSGPLRHVPLLACEGRLASICRDAKNADAAFQLLAALAGTEWGTRISSASPATAPFRASQRGEAKRWMAAAESVAAETYARAVLQSLETRDVVYALRIPGRDQYLAALDAAVRDAVAGKAKPQEALSHAAAKWREITEQIGQETIRRACENSDVRVVF